MKKGNSRRRTLLATGLASLALLATISTATYAWFSINTVVNVNVSTLTAVTGDNIQISDDGTNWGQTVSLVLDDLDSTVTDISGDGINFYTEAGNLTSDYVEFDLQFRASSYFAIYLNNGSDVVPNGEEGKQLQSATASSIAHKSAYGMFSKDYIAAAVRVAFITPATPGNPEAVQLVWAPNKNIKLNGTAGNYTVATDNAETVSYAYKTAGANGSFDPSTANFLETTQAQQGQADAAIYASKNPVTTITPTAPGVITPKTVKVRVWIDGLDPECVNPFLGGAFDIKLGFSAQAITQDQRPNVSIVAVQDGNHLTTGYRIEIPSGSGINSDHLQVSTDGVNYVDYSENATYANQRVYVRKKAANTSNGVPSAVTVLEAGKLDKAAPALTISVNARARSFTVSNFETGLQYSLNGGNTWNTLGAASVTQLSNSKQTIMVRYAATDTHNASAAVSEVILGKRATPRIEQVGTPDALTGEINFTSTFKHIIADDAFEYAPLESSMTLGGTDMLLDGQYVAFIWPGEENNSVSSDILYVQFTGGVFVEVSGPQA